jgi:outer membrane protein assembly factor BamB
VSEDGAIRKLERAVEREPSSAAAHAQLARAYARAGRPGEAGPHADRAAELDPAHEALQLELGEWRAFRKNAARTASCPALPSLRAAPELAWERLVSANEPSGGGEILVVDGRLLVPSARGVWALDAATGDVLWRSEFGRGGFLCAATSTRVFLNGGASGLRVLDVATGAEIPIPEPGPRPIWGALLSGGLVLVWTREHALALDMETGQARWKTEVEFPHALPAAARGVAIFGGKRANALSVESGAVLWSKAPTSVYFPDFPEDSSMELANYNSFAVVEDRVVGATAGGFELLDLASGGWIDQGWGGPDGNSHGQGPIAAAGRAIVVSDITRLRAWALDSLDDLWDPLQDDRRFDVDRGGHVGPIVVGSTALFSLTRVLRAIDIPTGRDVFSYELPANIPDAPTPAAGWLFVRTFDHRTFDFRVHAFRTA